MTKECRTWCACGVGFLHMRAKYSLCTKLSFGHRLIRSDFMKVIAIAAVTAGGKTTTVNEIKRQLSNVQTLFICDKSGVLKWLERFMIIKYNRY